MEPVWGIFQERNSERWIPRCMLCHWSQEPMDETGAKQFALWHVESKGHRDLVKVFDDLAKRID